VGTEEEDVPKEYARSTTMISFNGEERKRPAPHTSKHPYLSLGPRATSLCPCQLSLVSCLVLMCY